MANIVKGEVVLPAHPRAIVMGRVPQSGLSPNQVRHGSRVLSGVFTSVPPRSPMPLLPRCEGNSGVCVNVLFHVHAGKGAAKSADWELAQRKRTVRGNDGEQ